MSLEHSPVRDNQGARETSGADPPNGPDYWNALVNEKIAADFLGLTVRAVQAMRQRGDGPKFSKLGLRVVAYEVPELEAYVAQRRRRSTSEQ